MIISWLTKTNGLIILSTLRISNLVNGLWLPKQINDTEKPIGYACAPAEQKNTFLHKLLETEQAPVVVVQMESLITLTEWLPEQTEVESIIFGCVWNKDALIQSRLIIIIMVVAELLYVTDGWTRFPVFFRTWVDVQMDTLLTG